MNFFAILIIATGILVLALGRRPVILGTGVGALPGIDIYRILPGSQNNFWWWIIPLGITVFFVIGAE